MPKKDIFLILLFILFCIFILKSGAAEHFGKKNGLFACKSMVVNDSLEKDMAHWCNGSNILKMTPKEAKKLIVSSGDKKTTSHTLTEHMKKLDKLDCMHPDTVGELFRHHPDKDTNIDWACERYIIDFSILEWRIKSIKKKV